jgi:predicted aspartyl protease
MRDRGFWSGFSIRRFWISVVMGFALTGHALALGYQEMGPRQVTEGTVRFQLYWGYLIVAQGSAGPLKGLSFLLDTGASPTVLDPRVARALHLMEEPASITVVGGSVQAGKTVVPDLSFGPVQRDNVPVLVEDLSFLQKALPVRIDGVIGLDVLGQTSFMIDYASRTIAFGAVPALPNAIPLHMGDGLAIVDAQVNGVGASLLLDTGASSLTLFARNTTGPVAGLKVSAAQGSGGSIGEFAHKQGKLRSLKLGETEFGPEPVSVVSEGNRPGYAFDGLLSPAAMGVTKVAIDLGRGEVAFSR